MTVTEQPTGMNSSTWATCRIILGTLVVLLVVVGFLLLFRFRQVAVIIFSGIVISMAIAPSVDWFFKRGLRRSLSVILIYLVLLVLIIGFFLLLVPPIIDQLSATVPKIETYYQDLKSALVNSPLLALRQIASELPSQLNLTPSVAAAPVAVGSLDAVNQVLRTCNRISSHFLYRHQTVLAAPGRIV